MKKAILIVVTCFLIYSIAVVCVTFAYINYNNLTTSKYAMGDLLEADSPTVSVYHQYYLEGHIDEIFKEEFVINKGSDVTFYPREHSGFICNCRKIELENVTKDMECIFSYTKPGLTPISEGVN